MLKAKIDSQVANQSRIRMSTGVIREYKISFAAAHFRILNGSERILCKGNENVKRERLHTVLAFFASRYYEKFGQAIFFPKRDADQ